MFYFTEIQISHAMDKRHVLVGHLSPCRSLCEIHLFYALNGSGCNPLFKHPCLFFNRAYSPAAAAQTLATCNLPRPFLWPALVFKGTLPLLSTRFFLFCGFYVPFHPFEPLMPPMKTCLQTGWLGWWAVGLADQVSQWGQICGCR